MKTHVFIGTTCGPIAIQRITQEESGVQSVVCLNGTVEALPISAAYHDFVRRGTGIVARDFGHDAFRVDVAERVDQGVSWQLPMYVAHAVQANGRLGNGAPESGDTVIWATGEVGADGVIRPVERTADKLTQSLEQIRQWREAGINVRILVPDSNLAEGVEQVSDLAGVAGVHTLGEALESFSDSSQSRRKKSGAGVLARHGSAWRWAAVAAALALVLIAAWWYLACPTCGGGDVIILDDFGGEVVRPESISDTRRQAPAIERSNRSETPSSPSAADSAVVYGMFGDERCTETYPVALKAGQTRLQADDSATFCGLELGAAANTRPMAIVLPEGRALQVGPVRQGRRAVLLERDAGQASHIALLWPQSQQALRAESLFQGWLKARRDAEGQLEKKDIERWVSENDGFARVRFVKIESD